MKEVKDKKSYGQGKLEFFLLLAALAFAVFSFIGLINAEFRGYIQQWIFRF